MRPWPRARAGEPLHVYSGCDRRGGHLYRFLSDGIVSNPSDPANSRPSTRHLYGAVFNSDGTGSGGSHSQHPGEPTAGPSEGAHSDRTRAGAESLDSPAATAAYRQRHSTLGDLYAGEGEAQLGALLIDAHLAASRWHHPHSAAGRHGS